MTTSGGRTGVRTLGVGALAPALGAAAHLEAGGGPPELTPAVGLVAVATAGTAAWVVRRRLRAFRVAVTLGTGQLAWHLAMGSAMGSGSHAGHGMSHGPAHGTAAGLSPGMVAAHVLVTLLVGLGAAGVDRAVATMLAARVVGVLRLLCTASPSPTAPPAGSRVRAARTGTARPVLAALLRTHPLRGPPVCRAS